MRRFGGAFALAAALLGGAASGQDKKTETKTAEKIAAKAVTPSLKHLDGLPFVVVADGSGGSTAAGDALKQVAREEHIPLVVQPIRWSPFGRSAKDYCDQECRFVAAARMADFVQFVRKDCPKSSITLLGYSAGAHVALLAAELLPERSVDRVILLGSAVSACYDLTTRALEDGAPAASTPTGAAMDGVLEIAADCIGIGRPALPTPGRVGFHVPKETAAKEKALFARFHQYKWSEGMGGFGGHSTYVRESFVRRTLVPSLFVTETVAETKRDK
ncbi:MAG: alpha/beta hydrolase [Gemmataceae bacterium]